MKPLLIANPAAGRRWQSFSKIQEALPAWLPQSTPLRITESIGDAKRIAMEACEEQFDTLIAIGGDGTIHEVLNGIMAQRASDIQLGICPMGTANDYAFTLRRKEKTTEPFSLQVDIGKASWQQHRQYFINVAGIGLPGRVAQVARNMKRLPARIRYTCALAGCMGGKYRTDPIHCSTSDGNSVAVSKLPREYLMISVAIGQREGSYLLSPKAQLDDGVFDVLEVGALRRRDIVRYFPRILRGDIPTSDPRIITSRASKLVLQSPRPIPFHLDGEAPCSEALHGESSSGNPQPSSHEQNFELCIELIPKAIRVELVDLALSI